MPLRRVARTTLAHIEPFATEDERPGLRRLQRTLEQGLPYQRQRRVLERSGSLQTVVRELCEELRADCA
jgi:gamma-glutamyl:cysteine ligase YbdK (ATP-grasp superfamily)